MKPLAFILDNFSGILDMRTSVWILSLLVFVCVCVCVCVFVCVCVCVCVEQLNSSGTKQGNLRLGEWRFWGIL
jgi:hypothetical protein